MDNKTIESVHISQISAGDTVEHDGAMMTVCKSDIKLGGFCGRSLFGDSYTMGRKLVKKITFKVPTNKGFRYA